MIRPVLAWIARRSLQLARLWASVLVTGAETGPEWPGGHWAEASANRFIRWLWPKLPWLAGLYALIVVIATAGAVINNHQRGNGGIAFLLLLPFVGGVALAVRRPLDGWRAVTLWLLVVPILFAPPAGVVSPLELWEWCLWTPVLLLVGLGRSGRESFAVGTLSAFILGALALLTPWPVPLDSLAQSLAGMAIPLVVGASVGSRLRSERALAEEQARVAAAQAERGALAERARIAREMHDIVAHHMSMIVVRCETAPHRLPGLNETGRTEIAEIGAAARAAMTDMRHLLGVLRSSEADSGERAELAPQPSIADIDELVEQAKASGLTLDVFLDTRGGDLASVPAPVGLSAYRIAQEALTNARKHAPGAPVTLRLRRAPDAVELVVRSAPPVDRPRSTTPPGGGHGLTGMRERAVLHGGQLTAGSDPDGGFTVRAVLPVPSEPSSDPSGESRKGAR